MKSLVHIKKGLGTVIGIIIFVMILLISLALILSYLGDFQAVGAQLSQAQINIYNHNNAKLNINPSINYIRGNQYTYMYYPSPGVATFIVTITCYYDPSITINVQNPSQITQTIEYVIISAGSPNAQNTNLIGTNQRGSPPNYQTFAYPYLTQLEQTYIGETIAPFGSLGLSINTQDLFSPYYQQNNPSSAPIDLYIPYKYYEVQIVCQLPLIGAIHYYYYAYYQYGNNILYYPYYAAPPYLPGTQYVPTDYYILPNNPVYSYGNVYVIMFNNWGDVYSSYIPLQYSGG